MFNREPITPIDMTLGVGNLITSTYGNRTIEEMQRQLHLADEIVRQNVIDAQRSQKEQFDINVREQSFERGDEVLVLNFTKPRGVEGKLEPNFTGPYNVVDVPTPHNVVVQSKIDEKELPKRLHKSAIINASQNPFVPKGKRKHTHIEGSSKRKRRQQRMQMEQDKEVNVDIVPKRRKLSVQEIHPPTINVCMDPNLEAESDTVIVRDHTAPVTLFGADCAKAPQRLPSDLLQAALLCDARNLSLCDCPEKAKRTKFRSFVNSVRVGIGYRQ